MGFDRVLVGLGRVLVRLLVIALAVVLGSEFVMLGGFLVVFCGFVVRFVGHCDCPLGNLPARSYSRGREFVVVRSRTFTAIAGNLQKPNQAKKMPPITWEVISYATAYPLDCLSRGYYERIDDEGLDGRLRHNLGHVNIGIATGGDVHKHHIRGIFGPGGADVEFTYGLDGYRREEKPIFYSKACRINEFRAHGASHDSG
jgi:hypothetical protein